MGGALWGGSENLWYELAKLSLKKGDELLVSVYEWDTIHPKINLLKNEGATIFFRKRLIGNVKFPQRIIRFLKNRKFATERDYKNILEFKPDTIFISQGSDFDFATQHKVLYNLIRERKIPYSFICHSHSQFSFIPLNNIYPEAVKVFTNAEHVFFISKRQQKLTERKLVTRLTNGLFTWNPLNLVAPSKPLQWPEENKIYMAIVGELDGSKGQDTALEVLSQLQWQNRKWQLNIYGKGRGEAYLKKLALHYKIDDRVVFKGYENDILNIWLNNHILLVPSAWDGMPISLIEALICGRPAVVTDIGGMVEIVHEGENGFVAASPTVQTYSDALERAWLKKTEWQQMGFNAYGLIKNIIDLQPEKAIYKMIVKNSF